MVIARDGPNSQLRGLVLTVQAERELVSGTVRRALSYVDVLSLSERDPRWFDEDARDLKDLRDQLELFAADVRTARTALDPEITALQQLESKTGADQGELATELANMIPAAAAADQFDVAIDSFQRLMNLHPGFGDLGYLERSQPEELLQRLVAGCYDNSDIELSPASKKVPISECAQAALTAAGLVAQDALTNLRAEAPEQRMSPNNSFVLDEVISYMAPLLADDRIYPHAALAELLEWSVSARPTHVSAAAEDRLLPATDASNPALGSALRNWHVALSAWLRSEANAECAELTTPTPTDLERLRATAEADTAAAEGAWKQLTAQVPDGALAPVNNGLDLEALQHSLGRNEAIAIYITTDANIGGCPEEC